ncbi:helix-turn-helix domain-containing protein [soil metagenome]
MPGTPRFLTLADVAEILSTSSAQVYAMVRRGELEAIKIGGRGQWRVEGAKRDEYIARMYRDTATFVAEHPYIEAEQE